MKIPKTIKINKCRLCFNKKLKKIHNFGNHYVSNFVDKKNIKKGIYIIQIIRNNESLANKKFLISY